MNPLPFDWSLVRALLDAGPTMDRALVGMAAFPVPMWLAAHRGVHTSRRVRVVRELGSAQGPSQSRRYTSTPSFRLPTTTSVSPSPSMSIDRTA